jgi:DNA uptake protein ComE-like DNA-binding protein
VSDSNANRLLSPFSFLPLPVNTAEKEVLMTIKGIGEVLAEAIITHRTQVGPILDSGDLLELPGVGEKRAISLTAELVFDTAK